MRTIDPRPEPSNLEAETALLCCVLTDDMDAVYRQIGHELEPDDFHRTQHARLWSVIKSVFDSGERLIFAQVLKVLDETDQMDAVGGADALMQIVHAMDIPSNWEWYTREILECSRARRVLRKCREVIEVAYNKPGVAPAALMEATDGVSHASRELTGHVSEGLDEMAEEAVKKIDPSTGEDGTLSLGIPSLRSEYLSPGDFMVVAAVPGAGKSSFVQDLALRWATFVQKPVVLLSREMTRRQVQRRLAFFSADIQDPRGKGLEGEAREHFLHTLNHVRSLPIWVPSAREFPRDAEALGRWIQSTAAREKPCAYIVDYLQILSARGSNRTEQVGRISTALREAASLSGVPVIAVSALNRELLKEGREPRMSDLREAGQIEYDATHIVFLHRKWDSLGPAEKKREEANEETLSRVLTLKVGKARFTPAGKRVDMRMTDVGRVMEVAK